MKTFSKLKEEATNVGRVICPEITGVKSKPAYTAMLKTSARKTAITKRPMYFKAVFTIA